jgi:hypothetical protein
MGIFSKNGFFSKAGKSAFKGIKAAGKVVGKASKTTYNKALKPGFEKVVKPAAKFGVKAVKKTGGFVVDRFKKVDDKIQGVGDNLISMTKPGNLILIGIVGLGVVITLPKLIDSVQGKK